VETFNIWLSVVVVLVEAHQLLVTLVAVVVVQEDL
jgi:hypothetical protein